jgi:HlyD family secretion protein
MKRWIIVILLVAATVAGVYQFVQWRERQEAEQLSSLQTVPAERGPLVATIGATGSVRPNQTAILTWQTTGTVEAVSVRVGDLVRGGEELARLKKTSLQQSIILAESELITAQKALEDLQQPASELALAQARQAITEAEQVVRTATNRVNNMQSPAPQVDIDAAEANVALAWNALEKARKDYEPYENKDENNLIRASLLSTLAHRQQEYNAAVRRLNNLKGTVNPLDLEAAENDLQVAQARLADARKHYEKLLHGADSEDIRGAETRIAAIEATLNLPYIMAPFRGTITQAQTQVGDQVSPGSIAFRLDDLSRLLVDVRISEVDINRVHTGQQAIMTFDGILGKEYRGIVIEVAQIGTATQGVVEFMVTVELDDADEAVRSGMTAAVNIVVSELSDALLVPNRAVRVQNGQRVVYILESGELKTVGITLGLSSDTTSEVLETELKVGDLIVLNPPQMFNTSGPPPFVTR